MQLKKFRDSFLDSILLLLWQQWSSIGVAGYAENSKNHVVDPEALLALTGTFGRYDQRLFDEVLDWLNVNERFINVQRLRNILKTEGFESSFLLGAVAAKQLKEKKGIKWKGLSREYQRDIDPGSLFFFKNGRALPVVGEKDSEYLEYGFMRNPVVNRGLSKSFPPKESSSLHLQLRALFGLNSRSEVMLYLLLNEKAAIQDIADQTYYAWRSIQDVLFELGQSAFIDFPKIKKGRVYYLDPLPWRSILLKDSDVQLQWICWPPFFRALEIIWMKLNDKHFLKMSDLEQAADLNSLISTELHSRFIKTGLGVKMNMAGSRGVEYLNHWLEELTKLIDTVL